MLLSSFAKLDFQRPPQLFELCSLPAVGAHRLQARTWHISPWEGSISGERPTFHSTEGSPNTFFLSHLQLNAFSTSVNTCQSLQFDQTAAVRQLSLRPRAILGRSPSRVAILFYLGSLGWSESGSSL